MGTKIEKTERDWREQLTPAQDDVLRKKGTELAFSGRFVREENSSVAHAAATSGTSSTMDPDPAVGATASTPQRSSSIPYPRMGAESRGRVRSGGPGSRRRFTEGPSSFR